MPDLREEPGKIKYFDAAQHDSGAAIRSGLRFTGRTVLRATAISLGILAVMALVPAPTGAARVETARDGAMAQQAAASQEVVTAAHDLLELRRQRSQLMEKLARRDDPGAGSFDAIAAEIAQLDDEYQRQAVTAALRYPALGAVLHDAGPEAQDQRLLAATGRPRDTAAAEVSAAGATVAATTADSH